MREILFRGKDKETGEWFEGTPLFYNLVCVAIFEVDGIGHSCSIDRNTIGQYTGLTDNNGKRIFEGDIVKFEDAVADCEGYHDNVFSNRSVIKYIDGSFTVCGTDVVTMSDLVYKGEFDGEIIGNIYDNPELMEGWQ